MKRPGAYLNTEQGAPDHPDATRVAQAFMRVAPERLVRGSDWPHVTEARKPDAVALLDLLPVWAGDEFCPPPHSRGQSGPVIQLRLNARSEADQQATKGARDPVVARQYVIGAGGRSTICLR